MEEGKTTSRGESWRRLWDIILNMMNDRQRRFQPSEGARLHDLPTDSELYFVGIGGISMCGLAEMAQANGYRIRGSDMHASEHTRHLLELGIPVTIGQTAANIDEAQPDLIVYSAAVPSSNPELQRAAELGITAVERGDFLGWMTRDFARVINVAGTHGKTTTTAMVSLLLLDQAMEPTVHLGAQLKAFDDSTVYMGRPGELLISEACEYRNSFLHFASTTALVLNIDSDHLDYFSTIENVIHAFCLFADQLPEDGALVVPWRGNYVGRMLAELAERRAADGRRMPEVVSFAIEGLLPASIRLTDDQVNDEGEGYDWPEEADILARDLTWTDGRPDFTLVWRGEPVAEIRLGVPGRHNIYNALAAMAAALLEGADPARFSASLERFRGAEGRFTIKGHYNGALVVTDYAHHPTAVTATLDAAQTWPHERLFVIFQPLTFNRVKLLFEDFVSALLPCDPLQLVEIYSDRESDDLGMSSRHLVEGINERGGRAQFSGGYEEVRQRLSQAREGDLILFLGPEDVRSYGDRLVAEGSGTH